VLRRLLPGGGTPESRGSRLQKLLELGNEETLAGFYSRAIRAWPDPDEVCSTSFEDPASKLLLSQAELGDQESMMITDTMTYLEGDILTKVDRSSMASSLEVRVPMLDHNLFKTAWRLPDGKRASERGGKVVLREILGRRMPANLLDRPKVGFAVPIDTWLRGPLRDWAESLLEGDDMDDLGISSTTVRTAWARHLSGREDLQARLWPVLMLLGWTKGR
jgi:asparagine synthase (glutamine-hydrolysing)